PPLAGEGWGGGMPGHGAIWSAPPPASPRQQGEGQRRAPARSPCLRATTPAADSPPPRVRGRGGVGACSKDRTAHTLVRTLACASAETPTMAPVVRSVPEPPHAMSAVPACLEWMPPPVWSASMATWLITGANRGIGLSLSKQLAARGDTVIGVCRKPSQALVETGATVVDGVD